MAGPGFDPARVGLPDDDEPVGGPTPANGQSFEQPELPWYEELLQAGPGASVGQNALLGAIEGATFNHAGELGELGEGIGNLAADAAESFWGTHEIDGMKPTKVGGNDAGDMEALYDLATSTPEGALARTGVLGMHGLAGAVGAPATLLGQAGAGAVQGALASGGASGWDPLATGVGGAVGGTFGALGAGAGKGFDAMRRALGTPAGMKIAEKIGEVSPLDAVPMLTGSSGLVLKAKLALEALKRPGLLPGAARGFAGTLAPQPSQFASPPAEPSMSVGDIDIISALMGGGPAAAQAAPTPGTGGRGVTVRPEDWNETTLRTPEMTEVQLRTPSYDASIGEAVMTPDIEIGEAQMLPTGQAQIKAYAGMPVLNWSMKEVLSSGQSGLPPEAVDQLTSALVSGDADRVKAANFKFQQRYPEYQRRLQAQLEALNAQE